MIKTFDQIFIRPNYTLFHTLGLEILLTGNIVSFYDVK